MCFTVMVSFTFHQLVRVTARQICNKEKRKKRGFISAKAFFSYLFSSRPSLRCSSLSHRLPPASPSTHSIAGASGASSSSSSSTPSSRLSRGTTVRSTFHGGQIRDRRPPSHAPPGSPTPSHDASPLPHARTRATTNLLSKLTSKLTRR